MAEPTVKRPRRVREKKSLKIYKGKDPLERYSYDDFEAQAPKHSSIKDIIDDPNSEITAKVFCLNKEHNKPSHLVLKNKKEFLEAANKTSPFLKMNEAANIDWFGLDSTYTINTIGNDFVPLLGGPFNRQQYLNDMLKGHQQSFFAYHHDPVVRATVNIILGFVLGRGWRVDCQNTKAKVIWDAFAEANNIDQMMRHCLIDFLLYGEVMLRWLPKNQRYITYNVPPEQVSADALIPRVRLSDPSTCWEIITYPEDIQRVLAYVFVFPTQFQMYTTSDKGKPVPGSKYIYEQLQPNEIDHFKINTVSNEKRGRGEFLPALGYLKRLRDSVNYSIIAMQKASAWSMDTTIEGSQADIDNYTQEMDRLGTIPAPGSEFVHTSKITRQYLSNDGSSKGAQSQAFDWCFTMVCIALGIPQQYYGGHQSGSGTRGNAIVATEPVSKKFEGYQLLIESVLKKMAAKVFADFDIDDDIEVTFPDIVTQDRSQKLKDLALSENMQWISKERAANIAAKELGITEFEYNIEKKEIQENPPPQMGAPLTAPPEGPMGAPDQTSSGAPTDVPDISKNSSITSADRKNLRTTRGF